MQTGITSVLNADNQRSPVLERLFAPFLTYAKKRLKFGNNSEAVAKMQVRRNQALRNALVGDGINVIRSAARCLAVNYRN
jgi:hypothetical protein